MDDLAEKSGSPGSPRAATRAQILATFNRLLLEGETDRPNVAQIVAEAGVARSTFYDHFAGIEALFDESLSILLRRVASCLVGDCGREEMVWLLAHIWENRERGRDILAGPGSRRTEGLLTRLLLEQLNGRDEARLHSILIAGTVMAALGAWVTGRLASEPSTLADRLVSTARAILDTPPGKPA